MKKALAIALLLFGSGCLIDTVPLPEETPRDPAKVDDEGVFPPANGGNDPGGGMNDDFDGECSNGICGAPTDGNAGAGGEAERDIFNVKVPFGFLFAGSYGAAPGAGDVVITDDERGTAVLLPTRIDGTFAGVLNGAQLGDYIELDFRAEGVVIASESLYIEQPTVATYNTGEDLERSVQNGSSSPPADPEADITSVTRSGNVVTIVGGVSSFNEGIVVVAVNPSRGATSRDIPNSAGEFELTIIAFGGDTLLLFTVEAGVSGSGSTPTEVTAP